MTGLVIRQAAGVAELEAVRDLCRAYRQVLAERTAHLPKVLAHYYDAADYEALLASLPEKHARPDGAIFVALLGGTVVGCAMTHRIGPDTCEIKRVFTDDAARGRGVARALCTAAMAQSRADGYRRMVLDTMRVLPEAVALYTAMGFAPAAPFYPLPDFLRDHILFFEHPL